jgi:YesN/AraC family two-component response regulator
MKNKYLYTEHALHAEYEDIFTKECVKMKLTLENAIISGDLDAIKQIAKGTTKNKYLEVIYDEDLQIQKLYIASTITAFVELSIRQGLPPNIAESKKRIYYRLIADSKSSKELTNYYLDIVEELIQGIKAYNLQNYSALIKHAIEAIHNNKFKALYPNDISKLLHINRSHLSKKFKAEVGITLIDYITKVKMDMAANLMESDMYNLDQVAELLGFSSYSYFSRVFKKYYSVAPSEYKGRK